MTTALFPVGLVLEGRKCLVVGGGMTAARKVVGLLDCGARVTVVAPDIDTTLSCIRDIEIWRRRFQPGDVAGFRLVISATGDSQVNQAVFDAAEAAGVWINSADDLDHSSLSMPAVLRHGPVSVAVATGGASPALAAWVRDRVGLVVGPEMGVLATMLSEARQRVQARGLSTERLDWALLLDGGLAALAAAGEVGLAKSLVDDWIESQLFVSASG